MAVENNADFFAEEEVKGSRQPTDTPEFTIGTLRKAIPKECFVRSVRSRLVAARPPHFDSSPGEEPRPQSRVPDRGPVHDCAAVLSFSFFLWRLTEAIMSSSSSQRRRSRRIAAQGAAVSEHELTEAVRMAVENNADFFAEEEVKGSRQPTDTPEFTIGTLRKAIPKECFVRSVRSRLVAARPPHFDSSPGEEPRPQSRVPDRGPVHDCAVVPVQHQD